MRESVIEKKVSDYAKLLGWLAYKFSSPQNAGVPDHIYFREGRTILIEFKAPGKKPSKLQVRHIKRLQEQLIPVYVVDDIDKGKDIFNAY
tara:strand:- start:509 stop:778 length:270 start_codon:yes stop_codon:yes gene_type:complete